MKIINYDAPYLNSYFSQDFENRKFTDIWESYESFKEDIDNSKIPLSFLSDERKELIFYLLYASYGNSTVANFTELQFKYKLFSLIYQYAPAYFKRREIQEALFSLDLSDEELFKGTKAIYNTSENPSTAPSTDTLEELTTIDRQNTTNYKYSKIDAYSKLYDLIYSDGTKEFIDKFKNLFVKILVSDISIFED